MNCVPIYGGLSFCYEIDGEFATSEFQFSGKTFFPITARIGDVLGGEFEVPGLGPYGEAVVHIPHLSFYEKDGENHYDVKWKIVSTFLTILSQGEIDEVCA